MDQTSLRRQEPAALDAAERYQQAAGLTHRQVLRRMQQRVERGDHSAAVATGALCAVVDLAIENMDSPVTVRRIMTMVTAVVNAHAESRIKALQEAVKADQTKEG